MERINTGFEEAGALDLFHFSIRVSKFVRLGSPASIRIRRCSSAVSLPPALRPIPSPPRKPCGADPILQPTHRGAGNRAGLWRIVPALGLRHADRPDRAWRAGEAAVFLE